MFCRHVAVCYILMVICGCHRGTADSAKMTSATERTRWLAGRVSGRLPTPIVDAHFEEQESKIPSGHMGVGYSMWWLNAKIEIDPKDAPAWATLKKTSRLPPYWSRTSNPLISHKQTGWSMDPEDFDGAAWYDPTPLFGSGAHSGYQGGHLIINKAGTRVYVWQHWR